MNKKVVSKNVIWKSSRLDTYKTTITIKKKVIQDPSQTQDYVYYILIFEDTKKPVTGNWNATESIYSNNTFASMRSGKSLSSHKTEGN